MTFSQFQNRVELYAKSQICIDLSRLPIDTLMSRFNFNDAVREAVAIVAVKQLTESNKA